MSATVAVAPTMSTCGGAETCSAAQRRKSDLRRVAEGHCCARQKAGPHRAIGSKGRVGIGHFYPGDTPVPIANCRIGLRRQAYHLLGMKTQRSPKGCRRACPRWRFYCGRTGDMTICVAFWTVSIAPPMTPVRPLPSLARALSTPSMLLRIARSAGEFAALKWPPPTE